MKTLLISISAAILALSLSFFYNGGGAWGNMIFRLNLQDQQSEEDLVRAAIKQYNINSATFYNIAGELPAGLNEFPATPLIKRRIFKDIGMLKGEGLLMVFDRDRDEIKRIYFPRRDLAIAESREVWGVVLQDVKTREPQTTVKAVEVKVRYTFHKEPFLNQGLKWLAHHVDVYPIDEDIPGPNIEPVL